MSWDLAVFAFEGTLSDPNTGAAAFPDHWQPTVIGSGATVRAQISEILPYIDWSDPGWGSVEGPDYSLKFSIGSEDAVEGFVIHARGYATPVIFELMSATGWRILDTSTNTWMDETSNPDEGRERFQKYLDTVLETKAKPKSLIKRILWG